MVKRLILFALRLLLLNVIAGILALIFANIDNTVVQFCIEGVVALLLWAFVWSDASNKGYEHVRTDRNNLKAVEAGKPEAEAASLKKTYIPWFGFAAGAIAQIPVLALIVAYLMAGSTESLLYPILNMANIHFAIFAQQVLMPIYPFFYLLTALLFIVIAGLGYLNGPAKQRRLETIIERNKARKAKRVQDEIKANQKRKGPKKPDIRRE